MRKVALNKSTLNKETDKVKAFKKFVPALDLKRKQLLAARAKAHQSILEGTEQLDALHREVSEQLPMLANFPGAADKLIDVQEIKVSQVNLVGLMLPEITSLKLAIKPYSFLTTDHWMDHLGRLLIKATEIELQQKILNKRLELLNKALQKTTQRLNLFDKVLIPRAQSNIRKIRIVLSDNERAAVVTSKIAKNKRLKAEQA